MMHKAEHPTPRRTVLAGLRVLLLSSTLVVGFAPRASADVTYTYTGNPFTIFVGSYQCPPVCRATGSFTVPTPLPVNTDTFVEELYEGAVTFSFTDGSTTFSNLNVEFFSIYVLTDAAGRIKMWDLLFRFNEGGFHLLQLNTFPGFDPDAPIFPDTTVRQGGFAQTFNSPGSWSSDAAPDDDNDGVSNSLDRCTGTPANAGVDSSGCSQAQVDGDLDSICDPGESSVWCSGTDNCPMNPNANQIDSDENGVGDACECALPLRDVVRAFGWGSSDFLPPENQTIGAFTLQLEGAPGQDFSGRTVKERDAGGSQDFCWVPGLPGPISLGQGQWQVQGPPLQNYLAPTDTLGLPRSQINLIRQTRASQGLPIACQIVLHQQMMMSCPDGSFRDYGPVQRLIITIDQNRVGVSSRGIYQSRR